MDVRIGYSKELLDDCKIDEYYSQLNVTNENFFKNFLNVNLFLKYQRLKSLTNPHNDIWTKFLDVTEINAYYYAQMNAMGI